MRHSISTGFFVSYAGFRSALERVIHVGWCSLGILFAVSRLHGDEVPKLVVYLLFSFLSFFLSFQLGYFVCLFEVGGKEGNYMYLHVHKL